MTAHPPATPSTGAGPRPAADRPERTPGHAPGTRILLVAGLGGAGRSTVAAATALAAARRGRRTLLLTAEDAAATGALLGLSPGTTDLPDVPHLELRQVDAGASFRRDLLALQDQAAGLLDVLGAAPLDGDELPEPPGALPVALLKAVRSAHAAGRHDLLVVDLPPAADAVHLLALPEQARRWLTRLLPPERQAARALRPVLAQLAGVPMPTRALFDAAARWEAELAGVQSVLDAEGTGVRLVAEAGGAVAERLRPTRAGLALHGHRVESVVVNRLLPTGSADAFLGAAADRQQEGLAALRAELGDLPVATVPHLGREPRGEADLSALLAHLPEPRLDAPGAAPSPAQVPAPRHGAPVTGETPAPPAPRPDPWHIADQRSEDGLLVYRVPLPGAVRERLELVRRGDELVVTAGPFRRIRPLPSALRRCTVAGAALRDGVLAVRFAPDGDLWPQRG
ncbi:ArsA family ATPase [Streptomyces sp. NPDC059740]|uniref:ArsA family ATPase n=1 Tax=Streptomyces sp. NPDC059740 TaxID=3346926 RepID=UPI003664B90F